MREKKEGGGEGYDGGINRGKKGLKRRELEGDKFDHSIDKVSHSPA